uniref:EndoU nuclease n=1 Tax=Candidatus Kentrum sp. SD TaxID=2126332 RepID=A0A450YQ01_9GAMM|nr:MAG: EndoU nuclease [Candidatus Kentron sp. SD]
MNEKQGIVKYRGSRLEDRLEKLQKEPHKKSVREKADNEVTKYNNANADLDTAINHYNALTGNNERVSTKKMKKPEKPSWDDRLSSRLRAMGVESVNVSTSVPLYPTRTPQSTDRNIPTIQNPTLPPSKYSEMEHQVNLARSELTQMETNQSQSRGNWGEVQSLQNQQIFQENMSFKSAQQAYGTAQHEISQQSANMGVLWGNGVDRNVQAPPVSTGQAIESGIREPITTRHNPIMEMSGLAPFVLSKVIPKQTQEKVKTWVKDYIQEIKNDPLQARKDLDVAVILGAKKAVVVALQAFEQPSLKQRPNTYGLMEASNRFDRWVAGKVNVNLNSRNAQVGMFVGEIFAPMGMCKTARPVMKVGQEAIQFIRSTQRARPLVDRVLLSPDTFGRELRAIQAMQNPVHRSGWVGEKAVQQARKAVNMPSWKKVDIWMDHINSGHTGSGWRAGCKGSNKSLFPEGMTRDQIETAIRQAYRNGKKVRTRGERVVIKGEYQGMKIEMHVNTEDKIIETAYPKP